MTSSAELDKKLTIVDVYKSNDGYTTLLNLLMFLHRLFRTIKKYETHSVENKLKTCRKQLISVRMQKKIVKDLLN